MDFRRFPRLELAHQPTALEFLPRLTEELGGPRIFVKRDDCTGLGGGGNKVRKLEFLLADALAQGATTVITSGGVQSNHARQTASAAAGLGLRCELVLSEVVDLHDAAYCANGNILLDRLCGAALHVVPDRSAAQDRIQSIAARVRASGGVPYLIPVGGSNALGSLGYAFAAHELLTQSETMDLHWDAIVLANGSGGTHSGLLAGLHGLDSKAPVYGISVAAPKATQHPKTVQLTIESAELLGLSTSGLADRVIVDDSWLGPGYGLPTPPMRQALRLVAQLEGLFLDPVYTGKAMAGLIDLIGRRVYKRGQTVLFWHTGGIPGLFAYEPQLTAAYEAEADQAR